MDTPVSASDDDTLFPVFNTTADPLFEVAHALAQVDFERELSIAEQLTYSQRTLAGTAATGGWIEEQVDGLDGH